MIVHEKTDFSFIYCFHASVPHIDLYCYPNSRADYYVKGLCKRQTNMAVFKMISLAFSEMDKKSRTTSWCLSPSALVFWCQSLFSHSPFGNNGEKMAAFHTQQMSLSKSYSSHWLCWHLRLSDQTFRLSFKVIGAKDLNLYLNVFIFCWVRTWLQYILVTHSDHKKYLETIAIFKKECLCIGNKNIKPSVSKWC